MNWPVRCHDPDSCLRHKRCGYVGCPWQDFSKEELQRLMEEARGQVRDR